MPFKRGSQALKDQNKLEKTQSTQNISGQANTIEAEANSNPTCISGLQK